jgi:predicted O-methyltransferase YrrM
MIRTETSNSGDSGRAGRMGVQHSADGTVTRRMKNQGKRVLRQAFEFGQRLGFDFLPRHFYSEIPDIRHLRQDQNWRRPYDMLSVRGSLAEQSHFVAECTGGYSARVMDASVLARALAMNGSDQGYGEIEAEFLYCFVRRHRPRTIIQIGCGVSTAVCLLASRDEGYKPRIVCVEPYPTQFLQDAHKAGDIELVREKAQDMDVEFFQQVGAGDLFFVDSSHTLGPGGEVSRIILGILPRLPEGTYVHFHDIWFPYDYCPHVLAEDLFFLHETPLLYAFLCMNGRYRIAASLSQLFHGRQEELQACFPVMVPAGFQDGVMTRKGHHPSSIYLHVS